VQRRGIRKGDVLAAVAGGPVSTGALAETFGVTRQAIHHHLRTLENDGLVHQVGQGRATRWQLTWGHQFTWPLPPGVGEDVVWNQVRDQLADELAVVNDPTMACLTYGVSGMLNNAIDHSGGTQVSVHVDVSDNDVTVAVSDDGIGAFRHVREHFGLPGELDAIAHIAKGSQTTAPEAHSGQGLFFTSRVVDWFQLEANGHIWKVDNLRGDTTVAPGTADTGSHVLLRTAVAGTRRTKDIFDAFSEPDHNQFDRATLRVSLADHGKTFVSRSEAKRIAAGLEAYAQVELDFTDVQEIGQGFVDELFRVWTTGHPGTRLTPTNMNREVTFMVERGLPRPRS